MNKNENKQRKQKLESLNVKTNVKIDTKKENQLKNKINYEKEIDNEKNKYYIPVCRETGCGGYLYMQFHKFFIDCLCSKNNNHKFNHIFYAQIIA